jgi:hypothetical protein
MKRILASIALCIGLAACAATARGPSVPAQQAGFAGGNERPPPLCHDAAVA